MNKKALLREISITVDVMFRLKVLKIKKSKDTNHNINCTPYIVKFFIGFETLFLATFVHFQKEAASLYFNNSINKDVRITLMVS